MRLGPPTTLWAALTAVLLTLSAVFTAVRLSSGPRPQAAEIGTTAVVSRPSVEASSETIYAGVTRRVVVKGSNFNTDNTKLYFNHPDGDSFKFRVVSSTRIVLFVKNDPDSSGPERQPLKIVAMDTGAGALQLNPEDGGVMIGTLTSHSRIEFQPTKPQEVDTPSVKTPPNPFCTSPCRSLRVRGTNFDLEYTELYFSPPLPEEAIREYEIQRSSIIAIEFNDPSHREPGSLKVVAIETSAGLVHLNPEDGGVVVAVIYPGFNSDDVKVDDNETLYIYQSTKQFQITGSGFQDNIEVLFQDGLYGGHSRSILHTKLGEQPGQLTLELAEGYTWLPGLHKEPLNFPAPLKLRSANAGNGWSRTGPPNAPYSTRTVAVVFEDPSIEASETEIFHGHTKELVIRGTGFRSPRYKYKKSWSDITAPPVLRFDPPIDPELVDVFVNNCVQITVSSRSREVHLQWAPAGYFGPLKVKGVDTGAGMVELDPPVTVANIVPGSPYDFFLLERPRQLQDDGVLKHYQDRVSQAAREWEAMTPSERNQAAGALVPTPSAKPSSMGIYAKETDTFVVDGANFFPETRLVFEPALQDDAFEQMTISSTQIQMFRDFDNPEVYSWWRAEPGPLKVVAIDTGAGLVRVNPEEGGVVVAMVMADIHVHEDESLLIYESTTQIQLAGSGFIDDMKVKFWKHLNDEEPRTNITDIKPDQLTLNLAEGDTWTKESASLPRALLVRAVEAGPGTVHFDYGHFLSARKVATVFEDPSIQASDAKIYSRWTHELYIYGAGFNRVVKPILGFDPPLDAASVNVHVVNRTTIHLSLSTSGADWTRTKDYIGPLKVKEVDTGAGTVVFDSPVTVATVVPDVGTHEAETEQVTTNVFDLPSVEASSGQLFMDTVDNGILLKGTNFNLTPKLYFDSTLPEELELQQQFVSSNQIAITKAVRHGSPPVPWRADPGPLKLVAIDTGAGLVELNPEDGGVVIATVKADVMVQDNESLHIYQSTKEVQVAGSGFEDAVIVEYLGARSGGERPKGDVDLTIVSPNQVTLDLVGEGSLWIENPDVLPETLEMDCGIDIAGFEYQYPGIGSGVGGVYQMFGGTLATVFEDPTIDASDVEINRTGSQELVIWGTGFNNVARPDLDFDPPLNSSNLNVKVVNRTMIQLSLDTAEHGWLPVEHLGPLKIKGLDTGAGMVVFDSPVAVATVVPDSKLLFNQRFGNDNDTLVLDSRERAAPSVYEAKTAAESEAEEFKEPVTSVQVDNIPVAAPSVEASSTVINTDHTDTLVVNGDNFDLATRLIFDPSLDSGFEMRVFSRTEVDVFTKCVIGGAPSPWRAEPGPLKVVAIETATGLVPLNPEEGGVVVAMVE